MKSKMYVAAFFFASILLNYGCEKNKVPTSTQQNANDVETDAAVNLLMEYGFSKEDIEVVEDQIFVEGDIGFTKKSLLAQLNSMEKTLQRRTPITLQKSTAASIKLTIDASMSSWTGEINYAISKWNNVSDCAIDITTGSGGDILLSSDEIPGLPEGYDNLEYYPVYGRGMFPEGQNTPGPHITIDHEHPTFLGSSDFRKQLFIHEIGHTIGLAHTNSSVGYQIYGTPSSDGSSIMNDVGCGIDNPCTNLSIYDEIAIRTLYPLPKPASVSVTSTYGNHPYLTWSDVSYINGFKIYRQDNGGPTNLIGTTSSTSFTDYDRQYGYVYPYFYTVYSIRSYIGNATSDPQSVLTATYEY